MELETLITALLIILFTLAGGKTTLDITQTQDQSQKLNQTVQVTSVADGDTVDIQLSGGEETVRILGIDTPEKYGENNPEEFGLEDTEKNNRCLKNTAEKASQLVKDKIENKEVRVIQDPLSDKRGGYGRLLAYIEYNQTDIGQELLQKGYARVYESEFQKINTYLEIENRVMENQVGIWNESCGAIS